MPTPAAQNSAQVVLLAAYVSARTGRSMTRASLYPTSGVLGAQLDGESVDGLYASLTARHKTAAAPD